MDNSHPLLPGPRPPSDFIPSSYPPAPRRWSVQAPTSQSRGGYISPDASPTAETPFEVPDHRHAFYQSDYFRNHDEDRTPDGPPPMRQHPPPQLGGLVMQGRGPIVHPQQDSGPYYAAMQQRPVGGAHAKKGRAVRKVDGKQPTFLTKLYQILEQPEYHHIIRWDEAGEVIIIEKPEELADKVLPLVYRQSRFASFSRQLNIYGFMRKVSLRHVDRGICDPDASTWSHPFLRRSSTSAEIIGFKRRVPPRPSQSAKRRASMASSYSDQGMGLSPTSSEASFASPERHQHHYLQDLDEEKPAIFPSPPDHTMPLDEEVSPTSMPKEHMYHFDYHSNMLHRPMAPNSIALPAVPASMFHPPTNFLLDRHQPSFPGDIPASAPAHIANFAPDLRIAQGHIRTRSVQGEPPSATLFSPTSTLPPPAWNTHGASVGEDAATEYGLGHPTEWLKRGYSHVASGAPISHPMERGGIGAASLPSDFAPTAFNPLSDTRTAGIPHLQAGSHSTVSPGVYQNGFTMPVYKPSYVSMAPQAVPSRQERRASISSSPYSPRTKAGQVSLGGVVRGVSLRRGSKATTDGVDGVVKMEKNVDEALPSAGIWDLHQGPFDGVFGSEGGVAN